MPDDGARRESGVASLAASVIRVVDSHTEGEPTRVIVDGWPQPAGDTMQERATDLRRNHDHLRRAVVCEPRGHSAIVGALLTPPVNPSSLAGIVFFNNGTYLGMCGHGLIGVVRTLEYLGRLSPEELQDRRGREEALHPGDIVGRSGLERQWDAYLRGRDGIVQG